MQRSLFMAYDCNYVPMAPAIRNEVRDSLVFDMSRHSIYAQNEEFGYVGNALSEVTVRNANDDNESTIILTTYNGISYLSEYIPVSFDSFSARVSSNVISTSSIFEAGTDITVNNFVAKFKGTGPATYVGIQKEESNLFTDIVVMPTTTGNINCTTDLLWHDIPDSSNLNIVVNSDATEYEKTVTFTGSVMDDRMVSMPAKYTAATSSFTLTWYNHAFVGHIAGTNADGKSLNSVEIMNEIQSSTLTNVLNNNMSGTQLNSLLIYRDLLTNDYRVDTKENPIECTNGVGTYVFFAIPSTLAAETKVSIGTDSTNRKSATGILGGAAVQEFRDPFKMSYTNGQGLAMDYDVFVATGQNWAGKTFSIS